MSDARGDEPTVAQDGSEPVEATGGELRGRVAGRYDILALVGTGGMGNVYRALDRELGEEVALKVLRRTPGAAAASAALERFRHEVRLARRVTHVNVARTHDLGRHEDTLFLTMELVEGEPLGRRIARGPVPWREAVAIARGICAGVGAAHAAGVIHRDLKPDNVMLARDGRVVVTDWGIAATHELGSGEDTVEVTGTPAWMAPEQLGGAADARSDVYAIGEILFAMLTGAHPWLRDGRMQVAPRVHEAAPRLPRGAVPDAIADVVERALARDPAARFADAAALGEALAAAATTGSQPRAPREAAPREDVRVGVEPIRNLGAAEDDFVAAGLVEDLIDVLGTLRGVRVRALAAAGARDDLDVIVSGSLRRAGDAVRVSVRAAGARDGFQIWSRRFDRRLDEILELSDEVSRDVAGALSASTAGGGRVAVTDQAVVELYLRARQAVETGWLDDPRPLALYQAALERDPDSPVVLSAYATLLARRLNSEDQVVRGSAAEAETLARRAIARAPQMGEPWVALACVHYNAGRRLDAIRAIRLALERGPGLAEANDYAGRMLLEIDPGLDDAIGLLERAHWANPALPNNHVDLMRGYALRGDWRRVDELLRHPGTRSPTAAMMAAARIALWRGLRPGEAPPPLPDLPRLGWLIEVSREVLRDQAVSDANAERWRRFVEAIPRASRIRWFFAQLGTELATRYGNLPFAWTMLEDAVAGGLVDLAWLDRLDLLAPLRASPRFAPLRAAVAARADAALAVWRGPLPPPDPDAW